MNADASLRFRLAAWVLCACMWAADPALAGDGFDLAAMFPADPLLTKPPGFELGSTRSGNAQLDCDDTDRALSGPLALSDAVALAWCHHPQIQAARATIEMQGAQLGEARAAYLPTINVGMSRLSQTTKTPESQFMDRSERTNNSRYATLTWRLLDFGGRGARRRAAESMLASAWASHDALLQKTLTQVISAYFDVQTAKANRRAKDDIVALTQKTLDAAQRREARGAGAQSDTLQAVTALAKAELESGRALGMHEKSVAALVLALGLSAQLPEMRQLDVLQDSAPAENAVPQERDLSTWLTVAQGSHPALVAARARLTAAREKLAAIRSEGLPTLDFTQSRYINGRPNQGLPSSRTTESVVGVALNFPVFEGFGRSYKVQGAEAQIAIDEAELRDLENQVLGDVVKAHADATASLRNISASSRLIDAARHALDDVQRKYDLGLVDILEMLSVQMALADAEQECVRTSAEWRSARLRLLTNAGAADLAGLLGKS